MYNSKIGWCHVCNQGWVSIVKADNELCYCMCEECETEWNSPKEFLDKQEGTHFVYPSAINLSDEDVENSNWKQYIIR